VIRSAARLLWTVIQVAAPVIVKIAPAISEKIATSRTILLTGWAGWCESILVEDGLSVVVVIVSSPYLCPCPH
jgi:hypothetical protein